MSIPKIYGNYYICSNNLSIKLCAKCDIDLFIQIIGLCLESVFRLSENPTSDVEFYLKYVLSIKNKS